MGFLLGLIVGAAAAELTRRWWTKKGDLAMDEHVVTLRDNGLL